MIVSDKLEPNLEIEDGEHPPVPPPSAVTSDPLASARQLAPFRPFVRSLVTLSRFAVPLSTLLRRSPQPAPLRVYNIWRCQLSY